MTKYMLLNGPNLNLLGTREPEIYGSETLQDIETNLLAIAKEENCDLICHQSNAEHELVDLVHSAREEEVKCIIINPGALTHSSIALRDALSGVGIPFIEIHISNIYAREDFRQVSYLSDIAQGVISGLGIEGYELALKTAFKKFK
ncbi:type II 3-dehydroquinate dehydratase [Gammaproteobacteria bacterium]|nr:type II 3-dehydroquinate dehydratase [SAR86 cluster bacterium]MDC0577633.1 type II 3-dehydroquinate dehydratase [Gammaproteobacteria bacterium]|tara:strand:- start:4483 stop:4920 length:438 start_codon:yes stop_codon:yes gene_type:complete